ncbi:MULTISPECIES: DUF1232 domain-containing protein [Paenibacillus]
MVQSNPLGDILKKCMKEQSLSMRKLSEQTGMDTATISRIINGKQPAKIHHLTSFAKHLSIPVEQLMEAVGVEFGKLESVPVEPTGDELKEDTIQFIVKSIQLLDYPFTKEHVRQELDKYEQYAQTDEGDRMIRDNFHAKVKEVSGWGPFIDQLHDAYEQYCSDQATREERAILGSALLYFILSADIIPDYLFPIGYIDDAMAVQLAMERLSDLQASQRLAEK